LLEASALESLYRQHMRQRGVASVAAVCAILSTACGGGDDGGGGWSPVKPVISAAEADFINQFCDVYGPCCAAAGRLGDGQSCRYTLTETRGSFLAATYDPEAGEACLNALKAASSDPDFCVDVTSKPRECDRAMGVTGTTAPGGDCRAVHDCAPSAEGHVVCIESARVDTTTSTCEVEIRGKEGDGPCIYTVLPSGERLAAYLPTPDVPPRGILCYNSDGLYCNADGTADGQCAPLAPIGEACRGSSCVAGAYCRALICAEPTPAGATCIWSVDGCVDGTYCDSMTSVCEPRRAKGVGCLTSYQCLSDNCTDGFCGDSSVEAALAFYCGS